jgi:hypothetical protein
MTLQQTIKIPANRRVHFDFDLPRDIPTGAAKIEFTITPFRSPRPEADCKSTPDAREEFRRVVRETHGAWSAHPWTNHLADVRAMREEWDEHDPWKGVTETDNG